MSMYLYECLFDPDRIKFNLTECLEFDLEFFLLYVKEVIYCKHPNLDVIYGYLDTLSKIEWVKYIACSHK